MKMKWKCVLILTLIWFAAAVCPAAEKKSSAAAPAQTAGNEQATSADAVLNELEKRYGGKGFSSDFYQRSTVKAMNITDEAQGRLWISHPDKMRWEYDIPEKQIIIANQDDLWVYRPSDNQVMTGRAGVYFGAGKGAGFLSDVTRIREMFAVEMKDSSADRFTLELRPKEKSMELALVRLEVSRNGRQVEKVVSYNSQEDETVIEFKNYLFDVETPSSLFTFTTPPGVDEVRLEE